MSPVLRRTGVAGEVAESSALSTAVYNSIICRREGVGLISSPLFDGMGGAQVTLSRVTEPKSHTGTLSDTRASVSIRRETGAYHVDSDYNTNSAQALTLGAKYFPSVIAFPHN
jgi:hypothetical protein